MDHLVSAGLVGPATLGMLTGRGCRPSGYRRGRCRQRISGGWRGAWIYFSKLCRSGYASFVLSTFPSSSRQQQLPSVWERNSPLATCLNFRVRLNGILSRFFILGLIPARDSNLGSRDIKMKPYGPSRHIMITV